MRITLFDYGAGNLHSLMKALAGPERDVRSETDPVAALATDVLVLPGVGAFGAAAARLAPGRAAMRDAILAGFESSEEGDGAGLAVLGGRVERLRARRLPQIGWNTLEAVREPLITTSGLTTAYYANGFVCRAEDPSALTAWSTHEDDRFAAAVRVARCIGVQFHPEKSSTPGRLFVDGFLRALQDGALPPLSDS